MSSASLHESFLNSYEQVLSKYSFCLQFIQDGLNDALDSFLDLVQVYKRFVLA